MYSSYKSLCPSVKSKSKLVNSSQFLIESFKSCLIFFLSINAVANFKTMFLIYNSRPKNIKSLLSSCALRAKISFF